MAETKAQRQKRLKALRRKYGLGEFKNKSKSKSKPRRRHKSVNKSTKSKARTMPKRRKSYRKSKGMFGALNKPLVSGLTYAFVQPLVSNLLSQFNIGIQDELVQILAAVVLKGAVKNPIVNNWANAAIIINTASLVSGFSGNLFGSLGTSAAPAAANNIIG